MDDPSQSGKRVTFMDGEYLSYLMGAKTVQDSELEHRGIRIKGKSESGSLMLEIPSASLGSYIELVKKKLEEGFWNEIVGEKEILFIFKFKGAEIQEFKLSPENEAEVGKLCMEFNHEPPGKTDIVYKYLSENSFYHDFMMKHYGDLINR